MSTPRHPRKELLISRQILCVEISAGWESEAGGKIILFMFTRSSRGVSVGVLKQLFGQTREAQVRAEEI